MTNTCGGSFVIFWTCIMKYFYLFTSQTLSPPPNINPRYATGMKYYIYSPSLSAKINYVRGSLMLVLNW
jgi:hypothetical protein